MPREDADSVTAVKEGVKAIWKFVGIYADKGITGISMKKRDEFNKLICQYRRSKADMIIMKSISRFAQNTLDCIKITRIWI